MSERLIAIVPIRSLRAGKTRLSPVLPPEARGAVLRRTAERVITAALESGEVETVLVVSPDPEALVWAAGFGPLVVDFPQPVGKRGLNGAIDAGRDWAVERSAARIMSLFADLPLLAADDIRQLAARSEAVVLGPDRNGGGTNALLLRLAGAGAEFQFAFGEGSLARHMAEAERLGLPVARHESRGIGFDLDTPADWSDFLDAIGADGGESLLVPAPDGVCAG